MKQLKILAPVAALAFIALLVACKPTALGGTWAASTDCKACHSGESNSPYGQLVTANQAAYQHSGHYNGLRKMNTAAMLASTGQIFSFGGSNAMRNNGASCSQCHTGQGFVDWVTTGTAGDQEPASQPGCFTCHKPHETGDFSLRTQAPVKLINGATPYDGSTKYDFGAGNLCVNCHHSRTDANVSLGGAGPWTSSGNPHHGVQGDFVNGTNNWISGQSYVGVSAHATSPVDSCVGCHKFDPATGNLSGTLELGGHGFYLTGQVGTAQKDITALCKSCHPSVGSTFPTTHVAPADWDGDTVARDKLIEIKGLRDRLLIYFAGLGVVTTPSGGAFVYTWAYPSTIEWFRDFVIKGSVALTQVQAQSCWNLQFYLEDRSGGIHNPTFAAQILWDAIVNLNTNAGATIPVGATRPL